MNKPDKKEDSSVDEDRAFCIKIARMISDPAFLKLHHANEQPNIFRVLGRTFTETWHSAFLGWLLDPQGSHGLNDFPLRRFLLAVADRAVKPDNLPEAFLTPEELAKEASLTRDFNDATVLPNERNRQEKVIGPDKDMRIDVWIEDDEDDGGTNEVDAPRRLVVIVEQKVKASLSPDQPHKYPDFIELQHSRLTSTKGVCVYLAPGAGRASGLSSHQIANDNRWYCMDYQDLYDYVLHPCLDRGRLRTDGAVLVDQYIRNLRSDTKYGRLAMIREDRELAKRIVNKYRDTLLTLAHILSEEDDPSLENALPSPKTSAYGKGLMSISIVGQPPVEGESVPELLRAALQRLDIQGKLGDIEMPYGVARKTCLLNTTPQHPGGDAFRGSPVEYKTTSRVIFGNVWYGRDRALQLISGLLRDSGYMLSSEEGSGE